MACEDNIRLSSSDNIANDLQLLIAPRIDPECSAAAAAASAPISWFFSFECGTPKMEEAAIWQSGRRAGRGAKAVWSEMPAA
ncbi:hypothetical protein EJB05_00607 [Eragrostis curvula]|uniref:Uncharacterized protein n=1 Tax=Eragrostis curvula TaxID=38414 RepID=A0A5J9WPK9_9POAL|nr:hypothetical protein EJB05_00607 [Eragrostis curvula]